MITATAVHSTRSSLLRRNFCQRLVAIAPSSTQSRGMRFLRRKAPSNVVVRSASLADLVKLPEWIMLDDEQVRSIASVAALLHFRRQIDKLVDGEQVRQICDLLGEAYFDMVCEAPLPAEEMLADTNERLPQIEQLHDYGKRLLVRALPAIMADRFEEACGDPNLFALANQAVTMVMEFGCNPQRDQLP